MAENGAPPKGLGTKIDRYFTLRAERLALEKKVSKIKVKEGDVKDDLITLLTKAKLDSASGKNGTISIKHPKVGQVVDWPKLYAWIRKNNAFELMQRRLNQSDYDQRLEQHPRLAKTGIPGVDQITVTKFSATAKRT